MAEEYSRPASGFRFKRGGMKTNCAPDAVPEGKYGLLLNARSFSDDEIRCRPGTQLLFGTGSGDPITNIASYSQGQGSIRYLATSNGQVFQDDSATSIDSSFDPQAIQSMVPYRPNQSPAPYVYIGDDKSYKKFSLPNAMDVVSVSKAGIAEPQSPVGACLAEQYFLSLSTVFVGGTYSHSLAGGGALNTGIANQDTVTGVFQDPVYAANAPIQREYIVTLVPTSLGGSTYPGSGQYTKGTVITIGMPSGDRGLYSNYWGWLWMVRDVYPPLLSTLNIESIYYFSGTTGRCVIVPANTGSSSRSGQDLYSQQILSTLRRGAIVQIGSEQCFVLSVTVGPDGTVSFEVSTTINHTATETITGVYALRVVFRTYNGTVPAGAPTTQYTPLVGDSIYFDFTEGDAGAGINTITSGGFLSVNPFTLNGVSYQDDDYIQVAIWMADASILIEAKILFDIDVAGASASTSFTQNFYYGTMRPADYIQGIGNTLTELGAAQLASQRQVIDEEARKDGLVISSAQANPGSGQWSHIFIRIGDLIRVGNDQTRSLANINQFQFMFNLAAGGSSYDIGIGTVDIWGGFSPEVTAQGGDLKYRIRPRSSVTGAKGNPSPAMRYGVRPMREGVIVPLPTTYSDPQVDTWDIFRIGGTLTKDTFVGFVPMGTQQYLDNFSDLSIVGLEQLSFDDLEPWPSIDVPFAGTSLVQGTVAIVTQTSVSAIVQNYLPGNKVQISLYVYTLWKRPISIGANTWVMEFQENAGYFPAGTATNIYEPAAANQMSRMTWGPTDDGGVVFGLDPLRPGTVSFSKNFNPDSVPDKYNLELSPPSEPLMGGCISGNLVAVGSTNRKWILRPSFGQENQWTPQQLPGGGLASPFGLATDGITVFAIEKNGITASGSSITDEDLSNIFPHDGVVPINQSVYGVFSPPDFTKANTFRLSCSGGYLFFNYVDLNGVLANTLVYDIRGKGWSFDNRPDVCLHVPVIQGQSQTSGVAGSTNPVQLLMGDTLGNVFEEVDGIADNGTAITFRVVTPEYTGGEERANKQWGDVFLSALPSLNNAMTVTAISGGADLGASTSVQGSTRQPIIVNAGNPILFSLGLDIVAVQTFAGGETAATLYIWQPAYLPQPVDEQMRAWDWDDAGIEGNKFWQGFVLEANTNGNAKVLGVRDADNFALHPFTPSPVNFAQQSEQAFSFVTPFVAHSVRLEPQDAVTWNGWKIRWIAVPYPEMAQTWDTEGQTHGLRGFQSVFQINLAYISTAEVTATVTTDTGQTAAVTFPATGAAIAPQKVLEKLPVTKGKVMAYSLTSPAGFYVWKDLCEVWVGEWGRQTEFAKRPLFGGKSGEGAEV